MKKKTLREQEERRGRDRDKRNNHKRIKEKRT
jgi:hypothetical protein